MTTKFAFPPDSNPLIRVVCQCLAAAQVMEDQFQHETAFFQAWRETLPHLLLELDDASTVLNVNHPTDFQRLCQTAEVIQRPMAELLPAKAVRDLQSAVTQARHEHKPAHCTWTLVLDQQEQHFDVHVAYLHSQRVLAIVHDMTVQQHAADQLHNLPQLFFTAQEQERARLSHDLHDEIGQDLTAILLAVHQAQSGVTASAQQAFEQVEIELQAVIRKIRRLAQDLHPATLDEFGLTAALNSLLARYRQQLTPEITGRLPTEKERFPREIEVTAYRIVQEALTNIFRHAQAKRVWIDVHQSGSHLCLQIQDDGQGFDVGMTPQTEGYGLLSMSERVFAVGGHIHIYSAPGRGTQISAELPLNPQHEKRATA